MNIYPRVRIHEHFGGVFACASEKFFDSYDTKKPSVRRDSEESERRRRRNPPPGWK
jgi:hypothetical protein